MRLEMLDLRCWMFSKLQKGCKIVQLSCIVSQIVHLIIIRSPALMAAASKSTINC
jgi:hypothetical protein